MDGERVGATTHETRRGVVHRAASWLSAHGPIVSAAVVVLLVALTTVGAGRNVRRTGVAPDDRTEMGRADAAIDSLRTLAWHDEHAAAGARPSLSDEGLLTLAYVARANLGLGSPFRIAAFAQRDPRLSPELARLATWAVLARTARGATYAVDSTTLRTSSDAVPLGVQLETITRAIETAHDARTGEAAVRLGFALAASEGSIHGAAVGPAIRAAAQLRDRRLSMEDARTLLRASAGDRESDAVMLLPRWRAERRFMVEQPLLGASSRPRDAEAVRGALVVRDELRAAQLAERSRLTALAQVAVDTTLRDTVAVVPPRGRDAVLPPRAARRLAELATVHDAAPQAPIAVATAAYRRQLLRTAGGDTLIDRQRFAERARSEEALVAELAVAADRPGGVPADVASVGLGAAVAMRAFAQDTIMPLAPNAPTPDALRARFGLRDVTFDRTVPGTWRPYYLAQLAVALDDLESVLPWVDLGGLAVRVGESVKRDSALALHDPGTRTIFLPAATGAGTIAHELAHDLDWQTARSRLALRGTYSTDRAMRDGRGALALSMRGLAAARPRTARSPGDTVPERPAELFARGVDWYVATALASNGRSDGALTAAQDEVIAGYAGVTPPEPGDGAADALVGALADMTVVPAAARESFLSRYGVEGARTPSAASLVRTIASAPTRGASERLLRQLGLVAEACPGTVGADDVTEGNWRAMLLRAAAESRARGLLRSRARWTASPSRWSWEARAVLGGPWNPALADTAVARLRDGLLRGVAADEAARRPLDGGILAGLAVTRCR